jgi:putative N6-adenine-specific DNA methylase
MEPVTRLLKRIKQHVRGSQQTFFVATAPGLEQLCLEELKILLPQSQCIVEKRGGIEFVGKLADCHLANMGLRTASRILMRIGEFKATNFRQLEKKLAEFPWELYITSSPPPKINVSTKKCRLYHTEGIANRFKSALTARLAQTLFMENKDVSWRSPQQIFVRGAGDRFSISMDSSGDLLYKRGVKQHGGRAPLRETTAAAILKLSGYTGREILLDPMCGAGTFSMEAGMVRRNIPPGWYRDFAFMGWPSFKERQWAYLRGVLKKAISDNHLQTIYASDNDPEVCHRLGKTLRQHNLVDTIGLSCRDFFQIDPPRLDSTPGIVIINPPFGLRLSSRQKSLDLHNRILFTLGSKYKGWKVALLSPHKKSAQPATFKPTRHHLFHGGLNLTLFTGEIS